MEKNTEFVEKLVHINRITKVVKGGRRFGFSALVVVGNQNGKIGIANASGDIMLRTDYEDIIPIGGDLLVVNQDDRFGLMDYGGYTKLDLKYASIKRKNQFIIIMHLPDEQG